MSLYIMWSLGGEENPPLPPYRRRVQRDERILDVKGEEGREHPGKRDGVVVEGRDDQAGHPLTQLPGGILPLGLLGRGECCARG